MATTPAMSKPTEKYMQTRWGKTMALNEGTIQFDTQTTNMTLDEESIHIFCNDKLVVDTEYDINIGRTVGFVPTDCGQMTEVARETKNIKVEAEEPITFRVTNTNTAIDITELTEYHALMDMIHHNGTNKAPMPMLSSEGQEYDPATHQLHRRSRNPKKGGAAIDLETLRGERRRLR